MPWSIFSNGGGDPAAIAWAKTLLKSIGAPQTNSNVQVIYDWEKSEGGGGKYNPLNEGPVPGNPSLTSTGSQYGGGAADYVSPSAGIQGAVAYLNMPNFASIKRDLIAGKSQQAQADIINSPWAASHYGGGSAFSNAALPGSASSVQPFKVSTMSGSSSSSKSSGGGSGINQVLGALGSGVFWERVMYILAGAVLVIIGIYVVVGADKEAHPQIVENVAI